MRSIMMYKNTPTNNFFIEIKKLFPCKIRKQSSNKIKKLAFNSNKLDYKALKVLKYQYDLSLQCTT